MRIHVSGFLIAGALISIQVLAPAGASGRAGDEGLQAGENRWVPSFSITGGALIQGMTGTADSFLFHNGGTTPIPLQGIVDGDDLAVAPFVGGGIELMAPALPIPTRPRLFIGGEFLPTFASDREVAIDQDPGCIRGPQPDDPCISEIVGIPNVPIAEDSVNGEGTSTKATFDLLVWGANVGAAFPARIYRRQLRIKPSFGWLNYKVETRGLVVDADCDPNARCTPVDPNPTDPNNPILPGFLRETELTGSSSQTFNAIGPGLDLEMDVGQQYGGWLGVSLFMGGRAYYTLGDRTIQWSTTQTFNDQLGNDVSTAQWEVEVDPWIFRAHVGIRFQWLGLPD